MTINEKIFETMEQRGLKQAKLAEYLNVAKSVVTNWKQRGNNPPAEYIVPICKFLDISLYELLGTDAENFDQELIRSYHAAAPGTQECVRKLLDLQEPESDATLLNSKIG